MNLMKNEITQFFLKYVLKITKNHFEVFHVGKHHEIVKQKKIMFIFLEKNFFKQSVAFYKLNIDIRYNLIYNECVKIFINSYQIL